MAHLAPRCSVYIDDSDRFTVPRLVVAQVCLLTLIQAAVLAKNRVMLGVIAVAAWQLVTLFKRRAKGSLTSRELLLPLSVLLPLPHMAHSRLLYI